MGAEGVAPPLVARGDGTGGVIALFDSRRAPVLAETFLAAAAAAPSATSLSRPSWAGFGACRAHKFEVIRAIWCAGSRILLQSEVIRAIVRAIVHVVGPRTKSIISSNDAESHEPPPPTRSAATWH